MHYLWKREAEFGNHILLWCPFAQRLWRFAYGPLGLDWVITGFVKEELCAWSAIHRDERVRLILLATF